MSQTFTNDADHYRMSQNGRSQDPFLNGVEVNNKNGKSKMNLNLNINKKVSEYGKLNSINAQVEQLIMNQANKPAVLNHYAEEFGYNYQNQN